ncbi:MAG: hypothetical protein HQL08_14895 [Nitrospirae bacterium]|nr:hypothetical protein [Nitrospirota bacterium]
MKAESIARVLPDCRWIGACLGRAQVALRHGRDADEVARELYESSPLTLTRSRETVEKLHTVDFTTLLEPRKKTGSAENPVTKLFPAAVTERQFLDELDRLREARRSIDYKDERFSGHTLVDFTIFENGLELPINVKNAGTRFENAAQLVGLEPNDCIPIPAYKAHDAVEKEHNLLYAVSVDYTLIRKIESHLLTQFNRDEAEVWRLLNEYSGTLIRDAEDKFIYSMVNKHWSDFSEHVALPVFRVISARKAIRILQKLPKRTPGIGLRAWGTGTSAEVNVHICVSSETKSWDEIHARVRSN